MTTTTRPRISLVPVESSMMTGIGYDPDAQLLHVEFSSGHVHEYADVPAETHAKLMAAESKGKFFGTHIRGTHKGQRITGTCPSCGAIGRIGDVCDDCGTTTIPERA